MLSRLVLEKLFFIFLAAVIFSSCAPVYYPNPKNSPMFTKAGEFQGSGLIQLDIFNAQVAGIDVQGAISVSNHIALIGNFSYGNYYNNEERYRRHKFGEGGIGYYQNKEKWCYEIFAGYGMGEGSGYGENRRGNLETVSGKFQRFFIQPAFGQNKKVLQFSFVPCLSLVDFMNHTSDDSRSGSPKTINPSLQVYFEPAAMARLNLLKNRIFVTCQSGLSLPFTTVQYDHRLFNISAGIGFRIGGIRKEVLPAQPE